MKNSSSKTSTGLARNLSVDALILVIITLVWAVDLGGSMKTACILAVALAVFSTTTSAQTNGSDDVKQRRKLC